MNIAQKFEENYLLGCIKYENIYNLYLMPIAYWILNYRKYDPDYNPKDWEFVFRANILNVTDEKIDDFLNAIEEDKLNTNEFIVAIRSLSSNYKQLCFFIDFDIKLLINGFYDVEVEDYLPDSSWIGKFGKPLEYLPFEFKTLFEASSL